MANALRSRQSPVIEPAFSAHERSSRRVPADTDRQLSRSGGGGAHARRTGGNGDLADL